MLPSLLIALCKLQLELLQLIVIILVVDLCKSNCLLYTPEGRLMLAFSHKVGSTSLMELDLHFAICDLVLDKVQILLSLQMDLWTDVKCLSQ